MSANPVASAAVTPPLWLVAELTYTCPLHCVFCSNPLDFAAQNNELSTTDWIRVLTEARALGAVQLGRVCVSCQLGRRLGWIDETEVR